eukprot:TRINITY_DN5771_c0_g1_i9.p1 TRINITY_DN5771_c0_g1~~TRINITY_DN5771_c0_g1_i9.p1  ORF type:complete len:635 (-),score=197.24 TRINITY_DN5771_c0_g1_i9:158-2062(-)
MVNALLLQNLPELIGSCGTFAKAFVSNHIVPMMSASFSSEFHEIQVEVVKQVGNCGHLIDYSEFKSKLLPKLTALTLQTKKLSVRVNCLICISKVFSLLDTPTIDEQVLPMLAQCSKYDTTPAVTMACAGVYDEIGKKLGVDGVAGTILPVMLPMLTNKKLILSQFRTISAIVKRMLERIESARLTELVESDKMNQEAISSSGIFSGQNAAAPPAKMSFDDILGVKTNASGFADSDLFGEEQGGGPTLDFTVMPTGGGDGSNSSVPNPFDDLFPPAKAPVAAPKPAAAPSSGSMFTGMSMNSGAKKAPAPCPMGGATMGGSTMKAPASQPAPSSGGSMFTGMSMNSGASGSTMGGSTMGGSTIGGNTMGAPRPAPSSGGGGSMFNGMSMNSSGASSGGSTAMGGNTMGGAGGSTMGGNTMGGSTMGAPKPPPSSGGGGSMFNGMSMNSGAGGNTMGGAGGSMMGGNTMGGSTMGGNSGGGGMFNGMSMNSGAGGNTMGGAGGSMMGGNTMGGSTMGGNSGGGGMFNGMSMNSGVGGNTMGGAGSMGGSTMGGNAMGGNSGGGGMFNGMSMNSGAGGNTMGGMGGMGGRPMGGNTMAGNTTGGNSGGGGMFNGMSMNSSAGGNKKKQGDDIMDLL